MEPLNSDTVAISQENQISTDKLSTKIQVSSHSQCNARRKLEDRYVVEHDLNSTFDLNLPHKYRYYAIFDGHVNEKAAEYCKNKLHLRLIENDKFKSGQIEEALKETFTQIDEDFCELIANESIRPGTTALVCLIEDDRRLYMAWAGDSSSILVRNGQPVLLTDPHTPERKEERDRVERSGGECLYTNMWRVMGILAVSRSIGDPDYKPYVTAEPDVIEIELTGSEDFLILASDGLWDSLSPEDATTIVYEFLALNADESETNGVEHENELLEKVSKLLIRRSVEEGSSDNITAIVLFLKDLATISPSLKPIKQNGHQNGNHVNGHHHDELVDMQTNEIQNGLNGLKENGSKGFPLNVNATPFSPNNDIFNNIAMSGIDCIRTMQQKAWEECLEANINVTSNEDNVHDDNLQCAINEDLNNFASENDEQPHSILPDLNDQQVANEQQLSAPEKSNAEEVTKISSNDEDLERELDEERLVVQDDKLDELDEDNDEIVEELNTKQDEQTNEPDNTVECEYGVIPSESTASPVDLMSESTVTDHNEHEDKSSDEHLPTSPFEQIEETQPQEPATQDASEQLVVKIQVNDQTLNIADETNDSILKVQPPSDEQTIVESKPDETEEKSDENSFEFVEHQDLPTLEAQNDQNLTQYESPENSNMSKLPGLQDEQSVYENANPNFDSSILNHDLQCGEQRLDDLEDESHPFENDSEDSIKYLDKTASEKVDQMLDDSHQFTQINELADLMQNAKLDESTQDVNKSNANESNESMNENINEMNENINDQTVNLLEDTQDQENIDEMNKENVPQLIKPPQPTLLDSTLVFHGNPPNLIPTTAEPAQPSTQELDQINEDHFNDENDENEPLDQQQSASSNYELIKNEELDYTDETFSTVEDNQTNYKPFDMEITHCARTETFEEMPESQTVKNEEQASNQNHLLELTESALVIDEKQINDAEEEKSNELDTTLVNNLNESSSEYIVANQDPSFLNQITRCEEIKSENEPELIEEPAVEESKDNFVLLESPAQLTNDELNSELNNDQISELKPELKDENIESPVIVNEIKSDELTNSDKFEILGETLKETQKSEKIISNEPSKDKKSGIKSSTVTKAAVGVAAASASALALKKKTSKPSTVTSKQPSTLATKAKLTKDTKPVVAKDSKSTATLTKDTKTTTTTKPTSTLSTRTTLTRKPLSAASASPATKPLSTVTRKPFSTASTTTKSASTVSSTRLTDLKKPSLPATSKSSTALTKPTVSKVSSRLTTAAASSKPLAKSTTTSTTTAKSSHTSRPLSKPTATKTTTEVKPRSAISRPAVSKYANVTSKVSSSLASSGANAAPTAASKSVATKKPVSSLLKTATSKPSTATSKLTSVPSKVSSLRSTPGTTSSSKVNSRPATAKSTGKSKSSSTPASSGKATAVPRKPVNSQTNNNSTSIVEDSQQSSIAPKVTNGDASTFDQINENSNSIKTANSQLVNGQQNGLTNGDAAGYASNQTSNTPTSITSSKSRDKLANSLKAELEAAMSLSTEGGLPK